MVSDKLKELCKTYATYILIHGNQIIFESDNAADTALRLPVSAERYRHRFREHLVNTGLAVYKEYVAINMRRLLPHWHREPEYLEDDPDYKK